MIRGGLWLSKIARDSGEPPLVWLHHEPRFVLDLAEDGADEDFYSVADPWFDVLATVLLATRRRFLSLALGLLLVGHWEIASVPPVVRIVRPRVLALPLVHVPIPRYLRNSIQSMAPPHVSGAGQEAALTT
jgi:hypothetical protein